MTDLFLAAARGKFRFQSSKGLLTTEQLFELPLTSTTGKANLNEVAIAIDDERENLGRKSFVSTSSNPRVGELDAMLDLVKVVIGIKQAEAEATREAVAKRLERAQLLDAIEQADRRELGSKSADELRAQLAALAD